MAEEVILFGGDCPKEMEVLIEEWRPDFIVCGNDLHTLELEDCICSRKPTGVLVTNRFQAFVPHNRMALSPAAQRILKTPNAGGNSIWSEVMSYEVISALFKTTSLLRTEMEIKYMPGSKITDYAIELYGKHIGVSVTRAMKYNGTFTMEDAMRLLNKKLKGVIESNRGVCAEHAWERQILHIFAERDYIAETLKEALKYVDQTLLSTTIVLVTVCKDARWLFYNTPDMYVGENATAKARKKKEKLEMVVATTTLQQVLMEQAAIEVN